MDRSNRRNILMVGIGARSVMTLACGLASAYWELLGARIGLGIGEACLAPAPWPVIFLPIGAPGLLLVLALLTVREPERQDTTSDPPGSQPGRAV